MTKKRLRLVYLALLFSLIFPVIVLGIADDFSVNVINGLIMIFILAILVGLFSARYTVSWLIIILATIAAVLKKTRLKSEFIYYLGDGNFLIISPEITETTLQQVNDLMQEQLQQMDVDLPVKLKMATQKVDAENCQQFFNLDKLESHLKRGLETDIIVEYLKG